MCRFLISSLLFLLWPFVCPVIAADFSDPVVSVIDSDTIEAICNNHSERIRLSGMDCPE
jgi:endonuclease YncB( thermonuclease family)